MRFRFHGNAGAVGQGAFFGAIAAGLALGGVPLAPWFVGAVAALLALGGIASGLIAWDLELDSGTRTWELLRGTRPWQRRVAGTLGDFAAVRADGGWSDGMHLYLVPKGSRRGYDLFRGLTRDEARERGRSLAARLGLPYEETPPAQTETREVDLGAPPAGLPLRVSALPDGVELELSPQAWIWKRRLRVTASGLEFGIDLRMPWGRHPTAVAVPWRDVTQVAIGVFAYGRGRLSKRLTRRWRAETEALWRDRCAELKEEERPVPWWGFAWFLVEGKALETEMTVDVYRKGGVRQSAGSNWALGDDGLEWLFSGIVTYGRRQGARFVAGYE